MLRLSAAMYTEEMGENPMARDPDGYRRRVRMLISRGWTYVYEQSGQLQFKMDVGCASHHTAQIQGVYVPPELRGRGVGTTAMAACCDLALDRHPNLSLYVNDFNTPAVALYERIGFHREPYDFQTHHAPLRRERRGAAAERQGGRLREVVHNLALDRPGGRAGVVASGHGDLDNPLRRVPGASAGAGAIRARCRRSS